MHASLTAWSLLVYCIHTRGTVVPCAGAAVTSSQHTLPLYLDLHTHT